MRVRLVSVGGEKADGGFWGRDREVSFICALADLRGIDGECIGSDGDVGTEEGV